MLALPRSLAATNGISVDFFSSGYLDVSVPRVRLVNLCIQLTIPSKLGGFPHSEIPGSKSVYRLPEAYRRLPRPSSPVAAKAFTVCAYSLDHITPSSLPIQIKTTDKKSYKSLYMIQHTRLHPSFRKKTNITIYRNMLRDMFLHLSYF